MEETPRTAPRAAAGDPRRILVLSASVGAGHTRAAEAVAAACRIRYPEAAISHIDVLTLTPKAFQRIYGQLYIDLVNHAPELLGVIYDRTNRMPKAHVVDKVRVRLERLNTRPFVKFVRAFDPDVICHTHFLPAEILSFQKAEGQIRVRDAVVVTDFEVHRFWLCPGVHRYFVARDENRVHLEALGVDGGLVKVSGIPIDPAFATPPDLPTLRRKHRVAEGRPLLLVLCGGFGVGPVEELMQRLWASVRDAEIVVVTGRNEELRARLTELARRAPVATRVLGFTSEILEWMALASLLVTKPGGLTTSEALACGLPMVIVNPIPGQETHNATMLFEEGAAVSGENPYTIGARVARLLASAVRLSAMGRAARRIGRARAALEVADELGRMMPGQARESRSPG